MITTEEGKAMPASQVDTSPRTNVAVLGKALAVLECLNRSNGATAGAIAAETRLPRGTVFRLAETFVRNGILLKDASTGAYWLTSRVLSLSNGYMPERWVSSVLPTIKALERQLRWPLNISTPDGNWMEVRCATDPDNPFVYRGLTVGRRFPMLLNGRPNILLAYRSPEARREALWQLFNEFKPEPDYEPWCARMEQQLEAMKATGWLTSTTPKTHTLIVPLLVDDQPFGLLVLWTFPRSMSVPRLREQCLGPMLEAKAELEAILSRSLGPGDIVATN